MYKSHSIIGNFWFKLGIKIVTVLLQNSDLSRGNLVQLYSIEKNRRHAPVLEGWKTSLFFQIHLTINRICSLAVVKNINIATTTDFDLPTDELGGKCHGFTHPR